MCWLHNRLAAVAVVNIQLKYSCSKFHAWPVATSKKLSDEFVFVMYMFGKICTLCIRICCCLCRGALFWEFGGLFLLYFCISILICIYICICCAISRSHKQEMFFSLRTFALAHNLFWNQSCGRLCNLFLKSDFHIGKITFHITFNLQESFTIQMCAVIISILHVEILWCSNDLTMSTK